MDFCICSVCLVVWKGGGMTWDGVAVGGEGTWLVCLLRVSFMTDSGLPETVGCLRWYLGQVWDEAVLFICLPVCFIFPVFLSLWTG